MSPLPQSDFNLSEEELQQIALMHLNWGAADALIGQALATALEISGESARIIIHPLDGKKKAELLWKTRESVGWLKSSEALLSQIKKVFENDRSERNIYSHGLILTGDDGSRVATSLKGQESNLTDLPLALERSRYAAVLAGRLAAASIGEALLTELPPRPV